jgi:hypothetical protein
MKQSAPRMLILVVAVLGATGLAVRAGELPDHDAANVLTSGPPFNVAYSLGP